MREFFWTFLRRGLRKLTSEVTILAGDQFVIALLKLLVETVEQLTPKLDPCLAHVVMKLGIRQIIEIVTHGAGHGLERGVKVKIVFVADIPEALND